MTCPELYDGGTNLTGWLTGFNVTYSMYSDFSATATLENPDGSLGVDTVNGSCVPVYATLDFIARGMTDILTTQELEDCYHGEVKWIAGLITAFGEAQDGVSDKVDIGISSYFERLNSKPITSYQFSSNSSAALQQLLDYFAGIPPALYNYSVVTNPIWGSIDGGSVMDAIKTVAQLSMSNAYVQVGGVLEIQTWKELASPVELTIPRQMIGAVAKMATNLVPRLAVLVRGASIPTVGCGERVVSDARTSNTEGGYSSNPGPSKHTALSGIDTEGVKAVFANLQADREALREAQMIHQGNVQIEQIVAEDGGIRFVIRPAAGVIDNNGLEAQLLRLIQTR